MKFTSASNRIALCILLFCLSGINPLSAKAELIFTTQSNPTQERTLNQAYVPAEIITINSTNSPLTEIVCCEWISGPGSGQNQNPTVITANAEGGGIAIDLRDIPAGSVRLLQSAQGSVRFTVSRPGGFIPIQLSDSGPISSSESNHIIQNLRVTSNSSQKCAITISNATNVTLRNMEINHANLGLCVDNVSNLTIQGIKLISTSTPAAGPHCKHGIDECKYDRSQWENPDARLAIKLNNSPDAFISQLELIGASGGLFIHKSPRARVHDIVCKDIRGPYPRGQCVQFVSSDDSSLRNFYSKIWKDQSRSEDNVNAYDSKRVTVRDGLIDGNFSINGVGVIADSGAHDMHVKNIDAVSTSTSAISVWANNPSTVGKNFLAENIRIKNTTCESRDGRTPSSGGLVLAAHPDAINARFSNITWHNHCRDLLMYCKPGSSCSSTGTGYADLKEANFTPRPALRLQFAWEWSKPTITSLIVDSP